MYVHRYMCITSTSTQCYLDPCLYSAFYSVPCGSDLSLSIYLPLPTSVCLLLLLCFCLFASPCLSICLCFCLVNQKTFRYLLRFYSLLFRGFFVALFCLEKQCLGLFRYFFVAFSWLFRGPCFGQILRVLALEQSSE